MNTVRNAIFLGSPLIDILVEIDENFLHDHRLEADATYHDQDTIFTAIEQLPKKTKIGGSVTNTVRIFRKLSTIPTYFLGTVGSVDQYGDLIRDRLTQEGIDCSLINKQDKITTTGRVAVLVLKSQNKRTLITDLGASKCYTMEDFGKHWDLVGRCGNFYYFSGLFIAVSFEVVKNIVLWANIVAFNLGAPFLCRKFPKEMQVVFNRAHIIFGNLSEYKAYSTLLLQNNGNDKTTNNEDEQIFTKCVQSSGLKDQICVMTRAENSVLVSINNNGETMYKKYGIPTLGPEKIVDTNGAGDAFVGGFLSKYLSNYGTTANNVEQCVNTGIWAAQQVIAGLVEL